MRVAETAPAQCPAARPFRRIAHARIEPAASTRSLPRHDRLGQDKGLFAFREAPSRRGRIVDVYV
jgi:hypothetical protein